MVTRVFLPAHADPGARGGVIVAPVCSNVNQSAAGWQQRVLGINTSSEE